MFTIFYFCIPGIVNYCIVIMVDTLLGLLSQLLSLSNSLLDFVISLIFSLQTFISPSFWLHLFLPEQAAPVVERAGELQNKIEMIKPFFQN